MVQGVPPVPIGAASGYGYPDWSRGVDADPVTNWVWLAEPAGWNRALEVLGWGEASQAAALAGFFAEVYRLQLTPPLPFATVRDWESAGAVSSVAVRGSLHASPFGGACFDCVELRGVFDPRAGADARVTPDFRASVTECFRMLRPGGCLVMLVPNRLQLRTLFARSRPGRPAQPASPPRIMRRVGFRTVHAYYVDPSPDRPTVLVPAARHAVLRHEQLAADSTIRGRVRMLLARAGLQSVIFRHVMYLAYK